MVKLFARTVVLAAFGVAVLALMNHYGLFDFESVMRAVATHLHVVALIVAVNAVLAYVLLLRYRMLVGFVGIDVPFSQISAANFVSNAVGQWAPGALAVIELLRMSLMLGGERAQGRALSQNASRLAVASLFDRFLGFFTMLLVGGIATTVVIVRSVEEGRLRAYPNDAHFMGLAMLAACSFLGALAIAFLPFVARTNTVHGVFDKARVAFEGTPFLARNLGRVQSLLRVLGEGAGLYVRFLLPFSLSLMCMMLSCLALYLSSEAIGDPISFWAILATFPVTAIATLFPLGFGGLGGYQLVAVAIFGVFGVTPALVSSASVLQNALLLLVNTLIGVFYAHHSSKQIGAILKGNKPRASGA